MSLYRAVFNHFLNKVKEHLTRHYKGIVRIGLGYKGDHKINFIDFTTASWQWGLRKRKMAILSQ